jgi:hypothetical protein
LFEDLFRFGLEPLVDFLVGTSLLYLFYHLAKAALKEREKRRLEEFSNFKANFSAKERLINQTP